MKDKSIHLECECHDKDHLLVVSKRYWDNEDYDFIVHTQMNHYLPWYKRLKYAVLYLFGMKTAQCHFVDHVLGEKQVKELKEFLEGQGE